MRIKEARIFGFGQHQNKVISFDKQMTIFYGQNESGKTTIYEFILQILFGFPHRNQSIRRYEPKLAEQYGGQLVVLDEEAGECVIERVRGKAAAGDVTVYFEDGRVGQEEALSQLLHSYDRNSYEAIYAFSLMQLQQVEKMDEETLSRTLLASGTTGMDRFLEIEKNMLKEMGELFKKSGRVPQLNQQLAIIREQEQEVSKYRRQAEEYDPLRQQAIQLTKEIEHLQQEVKEVEWQQQAVLEAQHDLPLVEKFERINEQLTKMGPIQFPTNGLQRYEQLQQKQTDEELAIQTIKNEIEKLHLSESYEQIKQEEQIYEQLLQREERWNELVLEKQSIHKAVEERQRLLDRLYDLLGINEQQAQQYSIKQISLQAEEQYLYQLQEVERLDRIIEQLHQDQEEALKERQYEQEAYDRIPKLSSSDQVLLEGWPQKRQKLAEAKAYEQWKEQSSKLLMKWPFFSLGFALILYAILVKEWLVSLFGLVLVAIPFIANRADKSPAERKEFEQLIKVYRPREEELERLWNDNESHEKMREVHRIALERIEHKLQYIQQQIETSQQQQGIHYAEIDEWIGKFGLEKLPSAAIAPQLFQLFREIEEHRRFLQANCEHEHHVLQELMEHLRMIQETEPEATEQTAYREIRKTYRRLVQRIEQSESLIREREQKIKEKTHREERVQVFVKEREQLLAQANCETTEQFLEQHENYERQQHYHQALQTVRQQLQIEEKPLYTVNQLTDKIAQKPVLQEQVKRTQEQLQMAYEERTTCEHQLSQLIQDEEYAGLRQQVATERAQANELAKQWLIRKAIQTAIAETMRQLKEEQLPTVLQRAEQFFTRLTQHRYQALQFTPDGQFLAISPNGLRFPIIELSQATKEQVYVSLRFALAEATIQLAPFPILLDDPFVHFDKIRLQTMVTVLREMTDHQFIYFTCHDTMKDYWPEAKRVELTTKREEEKDV